MRKQIPRPRKKTWSNLWFESWNLNSYTLIFVFQEIPTAWLNLSKLQSIITNNYDKLFVGANNVWSAHCSPTLLLRPFLLRVIDSRLTCFFFLSFLDPEIFIKKRMRCRLKFLNKALSFSCFNVSLALVPPPHRLVWDTPPPRRLVWHPSPPFINV